MSGTRPYAYDVVVPTIGRASLERLLRSLATASGPPPQRIIIVDDRRDPATALPLDAAGALRERITVSLGGGRGPAAARNVGWQAATAPWVAFLDDDVVVEPTWCDDLRVDLRAAGDAAASFGRVHVPLPDDRAPTDWERNVAALARAAWITADAALRRDALNALGGFDERFRRAYREDTDLVLRLNAAGRLCVRGRRGVTHEVRPVDRWISLRLQAGNADDALMDALHGRDWRAEVGEPPGAFGRFPAIVGSAVLAGVAGTFWLVATGRFAWSRIAPGPRTADEIGTMLVTSVAIPFAACYHRLRGRLRARAGRRSRPHRAVLFDRDGTLIADAPELRDPELVLPMPGAREALDRLRAAGFAVGVVTNQDAVARGAVSAADLARVHRRVEELLGPLDVWAVCPHDRASECACRKPRPGLILDAAQRLGVAPHDCVVVGDILSDVTAARAAGASAVLVPTPVTRTEEIAATPVVAANLLAAAELILAGAV